MAKKRKISQNSTPASQPETQPEPEPVPEPEPEPEPEPVEEEQSPMEAEPIVQEQAAADGEEDPSEEDDSEEEDDEDEQKPQTLDPAASNGVAAAAGDEEDSDPQSIQKILDLFPKDQLVELLRDAALKHADVLSEVRRIADVDPACRKIFVHGLGWDTTAEMLTDVFGQFGEIEDCKAVTDKATGKSKGYAFILYKHRNGAQNSLKEPQKKIGNRMASCQLASAGPVLTSAVARQPPAPPVSEYTQRKIFVSNVGADIDPQKLLQFFAKFGEIEEGPLGLDKMTGKPRGFCLFVYKTVESAKRALEEPHKNFEGHMLNCQKAVDGPKNKPGFQFQHGAGAQYSGGVGGQKPSFSGGVGSQGHLMAPSATGYNQVAAAGLAGAVGYNQPAAAVSALNPAVNQALTAILLGGLGSAAGPVVNQGMPGQMGSSAMQGGYGSGQMGYGGQAPVQGGYGGAQMGQGGGVRGPPGYGPPYMGHH